MLTSNIVKSFGQALFSTEDILKIVKKRDPHQPEFFQAVEEVVNSIKPVFDKKPAYLRVMERLVEPERVIQFRVPWLSDKGEIVVNRGFRVQYNSAIGPYKGGLRFHPSVNLSIMKFLGYEQTFKNSLTGLPMGGGKGGSDFDPKGKTDNEVMKFCQSFINELFRHVGPDTDVPAGDIGVGGREIGFMFGQYKRITNAFTGTFTGKGPSFGGSKLRPEATGYGLVWYTKEMLSTIFKQDFKGKKVLVSGSGNVSQYCVEKLLFYNAIPLTMSDSNGTVLEPKGFDTKKLAIVMDIKNNKRGRMKDYLKHSKTAKYFEKQRPWAVAKADIALPCATQNEINLKDAQALKKGGVYILAEGANMPSDPEAVEFYLKNNISYGPAKASNAAGVACSGLEMSQNSMRYSWTNKEVEDRLHPLMVNVFKQCYDTSIEYGLKGNLQFGANAAGFLKVANAMIAQVFFFFF
jgi:glutamate dehydrogenase (NADP+)